MQHVDAVGERRNIEHPMFKPRPDSNLPDGGCDGSHRLPVVGLQALLNSTQLKAGDSPGEARELPQVAAGRAKPDNPLVGHAVLCKYSYIMSTMVGRSHNYRIT
jgi:hypothetical protein